MTSKPAVNKGSFTTEDVVSIMGRLVGFFDEHIELINDNMPAKKFFIELLNKTFGVLMTAKLGGGLQDKDVEALRVKFLKELATSFENDPKSLTKRQLFGFVVDLLYRDIKNMDASEEKKRKEETIANYEMMLNTIDPWVNYENKKYRFSRFMMLKRNACLFVKMPVTGEYLAMDKEKLDNGFSRMGIPMKAEDLVGDDDDERIPPEFRGRQHTELGEIVMKVMVNKIMEEGEKGAEEVKKEAPSDSKAEKVDQKVVELDPVAQAKLDKKKEANRKTKERKKAAKKAKKDQKAMDEKEDFKLEVVNEEGSSAAAAT